MADENQCSCPAVLVGGRKTGSRDWSPDCAKHGVGTRYFRGLRPMPFGYSGERNTTREQWLTYRRQQRGG